MWTSLDPRGCLSLWGKCVRGLENHFAGLSFRDFFFSSWEEVGTGWVWNCGILYMGAWVTGRTSCPRRLPTSVFTTRSLGPSEVCLQHIHVTFISLFSLEIPAGGVELGGHRASMSAWWVMLCIYKEGTERVLGQPAGQAPWV